MNIRIECRDAGLHLIFPDRMIVSNETIEKIMVATKELTAQPFDFLQDGERVNEIVMIATSILMGDGYVIAED